MSVLVCDRYRCENVMCDSNECFDELAWLHKETKLQ